MAKAFFKKNLIALMLACVMIVAPLTLASCQNGQDGINGIDGKLEINGIANRAQVAVMLYRFFFEQ